MDSRVFNVAAIEVVPIEQPIGGERWVQLRCHYAGDDSPLLVQLPEHAWTETTGTSPEVSRLKEEVFRLRALIHRDRTGLAEAVDRMVREATGRMWVTEGRGPYAWDDDRYRAEAGLALRAVIAIGKEALAASGSNADSAFHPELPKVVMWGGKRMKEGKCPPDRMCLACERIGKHLEPSE